MDYGYPVPSANSRHRAWGSEEKHCIEWHGRSREQNIENPSTSIENHIEFSIIWRLFGFLGGLITGLISTGVSFIFFTLLYLFLPNTKVAFGSTESLIEKFQYLEEMLGVNGIVAELNPGGLIPSDKVLKSLKLITHKIMPNFK